MRYIKLFMLVVLFLSGAVARATVLTERYNVSYLNLSNGLPHNNVSCIFTDSSGFLWIATYGGGLMRYDGYSFVRPSLRLRSNSCKSIAEDRFKRLWVTYDEGTNVISLSTMTGVASEALPAAVQKLLAEPSAKVYCDALGRIWLVTYSHVNMIAFDENGKVEKVKSYRYHENTPDISICDIDGNGKPWIGIDGGLCRLIERHDSLACEEISPLLRPLRGLYVTDMLKRGSIVWISTNHGLFRFDPRRLDLRSYTHHSGLAGALSHEFLSCLALTSDNTLLVGSLKGVNVYDDQSDSFTAWSKANHPSLKSDFVHCMTVANGLVWIGTESGGIVRLVPRHLLLQNYLHTDAPGSISPNPVNAMYVEPDGTVWAGTVEGGLNRKEKGQTTFTHYTSQTTPLSHNSISAFSPDKNGYLWVGTWGGGLNRVHLATKTVEAIAMPAEAARLTAFIGALEYDARNDGLWIGSNDGIFFYSLANGQLSDPFEGCRLIRGCIGSIIDRDETLWIGCMYGVCAIDLKSGKQGRFTARSLKYTLDRPDSKIYDKISAFCQAKDGSLWLGSNGYGIYRRTTDEKGRERFEAFNQEDGLVNDAVKGLAEDRNGCLWITTQNGLSVFDPHTSSFTNYSQNDGLPSPHFYWNSAVLSPLGTIYLGNEAGLVEITGADEDATGQPRLTFTRLVVDNLDALAGSAYLDEDISIARRVTLSEDNRSFSIDFSSLNYGHESQGIFCYRMTGFDDAWTQLKPGEHSVRYSMLPVGKYGFEVKYVSGLSQAEAETISIEIVVEPYFWHSWWFRLLLALLFVAATIYIYNRWSAELKRREAEQLLAPIRKIVNESKDPEQLQHRISNILDNHVRYESSVARSAEASRVEVEKNARPFMERVMEVMERNYTNSDFGVQEFCEALNMSRSVVSKHLNEEAGLPAGQFIRNYRLNMARELLLSKTGSRNITEIAFAVGFNDPKYFTRCFTKAFGRSPSAFLST